MSLERDISALAQQKFSRRPRRILGTNRFRYLERRLDVARDFNAVSEKGIAPATRKVESIVVSVCCGGCGFVVRMVRSKSPGHRCRGRGARSTLNTAHSPSSQQAAHEINTTSRALSNHTGATLQAHGRQACRRLQLYKMYHCDLWMFFPFLPGGNSIALQLLDSYIALGDDAQTNQPQVVRTRSKEAHTCCTTD